LRYNGAKTRQALWFPRGFGKETEQGEIGSMGRNNPCHLHNGRRQNKNLPKRAVKHGDAGNASPPQTRELRKCGALDYAPAAQFCHTDDTIKDKCGGTLVFTPETEQCCGSGKYTIATQFCYNSSKIGDFCGINPQKSYDPDKYECKPAVNPNGIYLKAGITHGGQPYNAVLIGTQVWMAENLNYNTSGSKCGNGGNGSSLSDVNHKGICPTGWHIPSNAEWNVLMKHVDSSCSDGDSQCDNAGKLLKATSGWNNSISFIGEGQPGNSPNRASSGSGTKTIFFSVRCLQN